MITRKNSYLRNRSAARASGAPPVLERKGGRPPARERPLTDNQAEFLAGLRERGVKPGEAFRLTGGDFHRRDQTLRALAARGLIEMAGRGGERRLTADAYAALDDYLALEAQRVEAATAKATRRSVA